MPCADSRTRSSSSLAARAGSALLPQDGSSRRAPRLIDIGRRPFIFGLGGAKRQAAALNKPNGRIAYRFHARDLHLVMGPPAPGTATFRSSRFAMLVATDFWTLVGHDRFMALNAFFKHLGLIAGPVLVSMHAPAMSVRAYSRHYRTSAFL
jgi:hypothetical protein